jgi:uncharacterized protein (DUF3820 family)
MAKSMWVIPFGKHKDEPVEDIPRSYLEWLLEQEWFCAREKEGVKAIETELEFRDRNGEGMSGGFDRDEDEDHGWNRRNSTR